MPAGSTLTVDQVAAMAKIAPDEVRTAIANKRLRAQQVQGAWMVAVEDMRRWLSRR